MEASPSRGLTSARMYCTIMYMEPVSFDWDEGNREKNCIKHRVTTQESEQVFFHDPKIIWKDETHTTIEERYIILGETTMKRRLHVVYMIRDEKIRIISARDQSKKERRLYENQC